MCICSSGSKAVHGFGPGPKMFHEASGDSGLLGGLSLWPAFRVGFEEVPEMRPTLQIVWRGRLNNAKMS